jgi:hypothetical protein
VNTAWLKAHWYYAVAGIFGIVILYELLKSNGASSTASPNLSGGSGQLAAYSAQADVTNAQYNAQVATSAYAADVANNQTAAALQAAEVKTAAELAATNNQTQASVEINAQNTDAAVQIQNIVTSGQVQQTAIEGQTLTDLATSAASVKLAQIDAVAAQIKQIQTYSKHASTDYGAFVPILAEETGQGATVGASKPNTSTTAQNISAVAGGATGILSALFGG